MFHVSSSPVLSLPRTAATRGALYAVGIAAIAAVMFFTHLGRPTMYADEAQYALCVEHARESGNWLTFSPYPPHAYFQKPPMYFWLTGLTYGMFGEGMVRYRFWSALFGVGCVALTCVLGSVLLSAEIGLLGGLLLLGNTYFQRDHGARTGSLDTAVTFFSLICLIAYWLARNHRLGPAAWWLIGAAAAMACLFKPAAGAPILGILAVHSILVDRPRRDTPRMLPGLIAAALICFAIVAPYYLLVWSRAGGQVFRETFQEAIVDTSVKSDPNTHENKFRNVAQDPIVALRFNALPWYRVLLDLHRSSVPFALAGVGIAFSLFNSRRGSHRPAYALLALIAIVFVVVFSIIAVKRIRYVYPAFPAIALSIAAAWVAFIAFLAGGNTHGSPALAPRHQLHFQLGLAATCAALLCLEAVQFTHDQVDNDRCTFEAWNNYQMLKPAIRDGSLRLVFYGFPRTQYEWRRQMGLDAAECFYLEQMHEAIRVDDLRALNALVNAGTPALLIASRFVDGTDLDSISKLTARSDARLDVDHRAFTLRGIAMNALLEHHLAVGSPCRAIRLLDAAGRPLASSEKGFQFSDRFIVRVSTPLRSDAWLTLRLSRSGDVPDVPVRFHALLKDSLLDWSKIGTLSRQPRIAVKISHEQWSGNRFADVKVELLQDVPGDRRKTTPGLITDAWLRVDP